MKVLIVDDTGAQRFIIKRLFQQECGLSPTDIDEAENGDKALDKLVVNQYNLLLVDWNMPIMDGLELVKEIRKNKIKTPIIMVTSENEESKIHDAISAGANHFLTKPFSGVKLMEVAKQYL